MSTKTLDNEPWEKYNEPIPRKEKTVMANKTKQDRRNERWNMRKKYRTAKEVRDVLIILLVAAIALSVIAFVSRKNDREQALNNADGDRYRATDVFTDTDKINAMEYTFYFYRYYYSILESDTFIQDYGAYGLDPTMKLRECLYTSLRNWYDRLSEEATNLIKETVRFNAIAKKNGTVLEKSDYEKIDEEIAQIKKKADKEGMSLDNYLSYRYCPDITEAEATKLLEKYYLASKQYDLTLEKLQNFTEEELKAYYDEHPLESLEGKENIPCVDIRMMSLQNAEKTKEVYDKAVAKPTEEYFTELVYQNSIDDAVYYGGVYDDVVPGMMVDTVDAWLFSSERKSGDITMFADDTLNCVIYYVSGGEASYLAYARSEYFNERVEGFYEDMEEDYPISVNEEAINTLVPDYLATDYVAVPTRFSVFFVISFSAAILLAVGTVIAVVSLRKKKKQYGFAE